MVIIKAFLAVSFISLFSGNELNEKPKKLIAIIMVEKVKFRIFLKFKWKKITSKKISKTQKTLLEKQVFVFFFHLKIIDLGNQIYTRFVRF